jgi:GNAT superfamily N-acetyltransferase
MERTPQLRAMTAAEVERLVGWAGDEGWNPGLDDANTFYATDPDGFMALELDGALIGGGAIIRHDASFGFMGLFIVQPDYRGQGLGRRLWYARRDQLAARLAPGATIGLDGVETMCGFYARGGFCEATRHVRFQLARPAPATDPTFRPVPVGALPWQQLAEFDRTCFPSPRDAYLRAWIAQPSSCSFAAIEDGTLCGYAVMRRCRVGWKIGPLFAEGRALATRLFRRCWETAADTPIFLDVPEGNRQGLALADEFGMEAVFRCRRMYRGPFPDLRQERIFGITTLELG